MEQVADWELDVGKVEPESSRFIEKVYNWVENMGLGCVKFCY